VVIEKLSVTFSYYARVATKRFLVAAMFLSSPPTPHFPPYLFPPLMATKTFLVAILCHDLSFGLMIKARAWKGAS
jgi:hypothetical protein